MSFLFLGTVIGFLATFLYYRWRKGGSEKIAQEILAKAEAEAEQIRKASQIEVQKKEQELAQLIEGKREKLDQQLSHSERRAQEIDKKEKELTKVKLQLENRQKELFSHEKRCEEKIHQVAAISAEEAKSYLLNRYQEEVRAECAAYLVKQRREVEEEAEKEASRILSTTINRLSTAAVSDMAIATVALPNQEMKGRVIGREGRNIRILEQATGMNFIIDDTPGAIVISGYDPVRKEIAKIALKELIQDGRIHPTRIEEVVLQAEKKVELLIREKGEEAALLAGNFVFHPELVHLLGLLYFRYSYGQNLLTHSLEVSRIMGIIAEELHLDGPRARRMGLLHDIGKAAPPELEGSHALIGQQLALKYGEKADIANGIGCHHGEIEAETIEASFCTTADALSANRLGARIEAMESYLKRSAKLEAISRQFDGVEKAYAMQAGRELRVIVEPKSYDDTSALHLARAIAQKIEKELSYPGKIKITVIRESKAVEYAQ